MSLDFETFYRKNKSYYSVKHNKDESSMEADARNAYSTILITNRATIVKNETKKNNKKTKPNPYGFDR